MTRPQNRPVTPPAAGEAQGPPATAAAGDRKSVV